MLTAYILIRCDSGAEKEVVDQLGDFDEIFDAEMIYGEWDVIAKLKVLDISMLGDFILTNIRAISGVKQTSTLIITGEDEPQI